MKNKWIGGCLCLILAGAGLLAFLDEAQAKRRIYRPVRASGQAADPDDVVSEAPLVQYPPPQNYPNSVNVGTPNYYYYYAPAPVMPYPSSNYTYPSQGGVNYYNSGGKTQRTFWYNTQIPGQVPPPSSQQSYPYGGYTPYGNGGILYIP